MAGCPEFLNFESGVYRSKPAKVSAFTRAFPSLVFYPAMFSIVYGASRKAKQGKFDDLEWCKRGMAILRLFERIGTQIEISGQDILKQLDRPVVFVGNHMSTLETFVLAPIIVPYRRISFVIKESLIRFPVFKHIMMALNPIVVGRTNPRDDLKIVLEQGARKISDDVSVVVFPQRTRTTEFNRDDFNSIGIKLARKANVPVVPIAIKTDAWGIGKWIKDFGKIDPKKTVRLAFGEPMEIRHRGTEEHQMVIDFIEQHLEMWKE